MICAGLSPAAKTAAPLGQPGERHRAARGRAARVEFAGCGRLRRAGRLLRAGPLTAAARREARRPGAGPAGRTPAAPADSAARSIGSDGRPRPAFAGSNDRVCGEAAFPAPAAARRLRGFSPDRPSAREAQCLSMLRRRVCSPARAPVKALLPGDHSIYLSETCAESVARALPLCKSDAARHAQTCAAYAWTRRGSDSFARHRIACPATGNRPATAAKVRNRICRGSEQPDAAGATENGPPGIAGLPDISRDDGKSPAVWRCRMSAWGAERLPLCDGRSPSISRDEPSRPPGY